MSCVENIPDILYKLGQKKTDIEVYKDAVINWILANPPMGKAVGIAGENDNGYFALTGEISPVIICTLLTTFSSWLNRFLPIQI